MDTRVYVSEDAARESLRRMLAGTASGTGMLLARAMELSSASLTSAGKGDGPYVVALRVLARLLKAEDLLTCGHWGSTWTRTMADTRSRIVACRGNGCWELGTEISERDRECGRSVLRNARPCDACGDLDHLNTAQVRWSVGDLGVSATLCRACDRMRGGLGQGPSQHIRRQRFTYVQKNYGQ